MKPLNYTVNKDTISYHYTFSQLRKFLQHGFLEGNNGWILISKDSKFSIWRGFGTIENPIKYLQTFTIEHDPFYGEDKSDPQDYIDSFDKKEKRYTSYSIEIWDASKNKKL